MSGQRKSAPAATETLLSQDPSTLSESIGLATHKVAVRSSGVNRALTPLKAIRAACLHCCAGQAKEVRECHLDNCPLWPYRMGRNPKRAGIGGNVQLNARFSTKGA